jgi:hypothetical protein
VERITPIYRADHAHERLIRTANGTMHNQDAESDKAVTRAPCVFVPVLAVRFLIQSVATATVCGEHFTILSAHCVTSELNSTQISIP